MPETWGPSAPIPERHLTATRDMGRPGARSLGTYDELCGHVARPVTDGRGGGNALTSTAWRTSKTYPPTNKPMTDDLCARLREVARGSEKSGGNPCARSCARCLREVARVRSRNMPTSVAGPSLHAVARGCARVALGVSPYYVGGGDRPLGGPAPFLRSNRVCRGLAVVVVHSAEARVGKSSDSAIAGADIVGPTLLRCDWPVCLPNIPAPARPNTPSIG